MNESTLYGMLIGGAALGVIQAIILVARLFSRKSREGRAIRSADARRARRWLVTLPLWLMPIYIATAALLDSSDMGLLLYAFAASTAISGLIVGAAALANAVLSTPSLVGFVVGALLVSQAIYLQIFIATATDQDHAFWVVLIPIAALFTAPYGSALGWLMGALIRRSTT